MRVFLPEWHPQWGVMLAWPHEDTDWAPFLKDVEVTYRALATAILEQESLLLLCRDEDHEQHIRNSLAETGADLSRARFLQCAYDDTWTRDFGPVAVREGDSLRLQDFRFNGWGGKYDAERDNRINRGIDWQAPLDSHELVLEGGSIETNGQGTLLTTRACLLNPNRNPRLDVTALEHQLRDTLGTEDIVWLDHGALEGDDTDAHVDTLARFCTADSVAYVQCRDPHDSHYDTLAAMEAQLKAQAEKRRWRLIPLPLPTPCYSDAGERLPATYANFLIINQTVLVPTYGVATDQQALAILAECFPGRRVVPVNCRALIEQHGSLHCATMQLPEGIF